MRYRICALLCGKAKGKTVDAKRFDHTKSPSPYYEADTPLSLT